MMRRATLAVLAVASLLFTCLYPGWAAAQEDPGARGLQLEAAGLFTTLTGGAFPFDESGFGATLGARYRWPNGLSVGVLGLHAQPEDLDLTGGDRRRHMTQWGVFSEARYSLNRSTAVRPYLGARVGWTRLDDERDRGVVGTGVGYGLVAGAEVWAGDQVAVRAGGTAGGMSISGFFGPDETTSATSWTLEVGVSVFLGEETRDADGDGVADRADACPGTSQGVVVDEDGCAVDSDGDGVADHLDDCSGTPDDVAVDEEGCPRDGDGDGVPDGRDACPETPKGAETDDDGCAVDADGDGVADVRDDCPNTPEGLPVDDTGCVSDADDDGVPDDRDACPDTQYLDEVNDEGCSRVQRTLARDGAFTLPGLPLELGAMRLQGPTREIVNEVGQELARRDEAVLEIHVFAAREGRPSYNQEMTQSLADALRDYLLDRHPSVGEDRIRATGWGERPGPGAGDKPRPRVDFVFVETDGEPRDRPR